jgi:hypothetical protein
MTECPHCGIHLDGGELVCPQCGHGVYEPVVEHVQPATPNNLQAPESSLEQVRKKAPELTCAKCGSARVVPEAATWVPAEGGGVLQAYVHSKPHARLFKGTTYSTLYARVCAECGYAELYAKRADHLYAAYRKGLERESKV